MIELDKSDIEWLISMLVTIWLAKRKAPKRKGPGKHKR